LNCKSSPTPSVLVASVELSYRSTSARFCRFTNSSLLCTATSNVSLKEASLRSLLSIPSASSTSVKMTFLRSFLLRRAYSTAAPHRVLCRNYRDIYDTLAPSISHLLRIALAPLLKTPIPEYPIDISAANASPLPPGHHLVYFPPHIPETDLMADGSDATQSPG